MKNRILISKLKPFSPFYSIPVWTQNFSLIRKIPVYHFSESNTASAPPTESEIFSKSLASLKTVREILNTFDSKKGGITKSEIAILLKVMARMANPEDETNLKNDPTFKKINEEVIRNIDSFNSTGFFFVISFVFFFILAFNCLFPFFLNSLLFVSQKSWISSFPSANLSSPKRVSTFQPPTCGRSLRKLTLSSQ